MQIIQDFQNKLLLGDSFDLIRRLPDESIDMVLTDPPYGMSFKSGHRESDIFDSIKYDSDLEWLPEFLKQVLRISKNNTSHYFFCSWHNIDVFKIQIQKVFKIMGILVWEKNNWSMGDLKHSFASKTEFIIHFSKGKRQIEGGRDFNVLKFDRVQSDRHPTEKPVKLCKYLISKFSKEGDLVFDPFAGVGTTGVAAKQIERDYLLFELDKGYFLEANKRLTENYEEENQFNKGNLF